MLVLKSLTVPLQCCALYRNVTIIFYFILLWSLYDWLRYAASDEYSVSLKQLLWKAPFYRFSKISHEWLKYYKHVVYLLHVKFFFMAARAIGSYRVGSRSGYFRHYVALFLSRSGGTWTSKLMFVLVASAFHWRPKINRQST